jgi:hypothetical protein
MKFYYSHYDSSCAEGETIDRYPILDWNGYYISKAFEYARLDDKTYKRGFTGRYNKYLYCSITILRHKFVFTFDWGFGNMDPEQAKNEYHARRKGK